MNVCYTIFGLALIILSIYGLMNDSLEVFDDHFIIPATNLLILPFTGGVVLFIVGIFLDYQIAKWEKQNRQQNMNSESGN